MHLKRILVPASLLAILILIGCATRYEPPTSMSSAKLQIRTTNDGINMPIRTYRSADCSDYPGQMIGRFNSKTIGETAYRTTTTTITANEPFRLSVMAVIDMTGRRSGHTITSEVTHCQPVVEFVPQSGLEYEALHQVNVDGCSISVFVLRDGIREREPSARNSPTCPENRYP